MNVNIPIRLLLFLFLLSEHPGYSQSKPLLNFTQDNYLKFEQISIDEGLSNSWVWCILQDKNGFMWFGTKEGLNKYDGYKFTVYKNEPGNKKSLSNNNITAIFEDRIGGLWIGTDGGGLNFFDQEKEIFISYLHNPAQEWSISDNSITAIFEDNSGELWVGTNGGGLNRFDRDKEAFKHYKNQEENPESISDDWINSIFEDNYGKIWLGTHGGLNIFDKQKETFKRFSTNVDDQKSLSNIISEIYEDRNSNLWIGTWGGLYKFNREGENVKGYFLNSVAGILIMEMLEDNGNNIWIATSGNGIFKYNYVLNTIQNFRNETGNPNSLITDLITCTFLDRSGLLWFGTKSDGIIKYNPRTKNFNHIQNHPGNSNSLSQNYVRTIFEANNGDLWIGTGTGGLNKYDREKEEFQHYIPFEKEQDVTGANYDIVNLKEDNMGRLWIATAGAGLFQFDQEKQSFKRYFPNNSRNLNDNVIYALCFDTSGLLWIGTWGGLNILDPQRGTYKHYQHNIDDKNSISDNFIRTIYRDRNGNMWIGTNTRGVNKYDPVNDHFIRYLNDPGDSTTISHNTIESVLEDSQGNLWIGTLGGGLNLFNRETETFEYFTENEGLPSNAIHGILEDVNNHLWLSTNTGLSEYDPSTKTCTNYDVNDGLQSNEFNTNAYCKTRKGEMCFGGINGFNLFHPDSITGNPVPPLTVITDFQIFNKSVVIDKPDHESKIILNRHISVTDEIMLSFRDYVFSIEFATLDFTNPEKNKYKYYMEGFDADWVQSDNRRFVTYTNLNPGEYTFKVQGSNNDGIWAEAPASIKFKIMPLFWQTTWFKSLLAIIVLAILFTGYKIRIKQLEKKRKLLEERVIERTNAAQKLKVALDEVEILKNRLQEENIYLQNEIKVEHSFDYIIGSGKAFNKVLRSVEQVASTDSTVFILGETGTGKELLARAIHSISNRAERPLVKVNCATLPESLIESELFGHEKGAFTGAVSRKIGRFELANEGTIFLDEIGELPLSLQSKLLRVLQENEFERLGNPQTININVRVIAATNRDIGKAISEGTFREDLFYRLNVFPIHVPPLRERKEDIPLLLRHFLQKHNSRTGKNVKIVTKDVMEKFYSYSWPGNVRELENIIERAVITSSGDKLVLGDWMSNSDVSSSKSKILPLEEVEKQYIIEILEKTKWKVSGEKGAARLLEVNPQTLFSKMKKLDIQKPT